MEAHPKIIAASKQIEMILMQLEKDAHVKIRSIDLHFDDITTVESPVKKYLKSIRIGVQEEEENVWNDYSKEAADNILQNLKDKK
jgi:hypothetical protein